MKKYDLITSINSRGTFAITQACMPHMIANGYGRVITMSPPIVSNHRAFAGKTAYYISKFGMTMCALGAAAEGQGKGVTGNSLWPATIIESLASINFKLGDPSTWRKADILADCVVGICEDSDDFTGNSAPPLARALPRPCRPRFASVLRTCPPRLSSAPVLLPSPALTRSVRSRRRAVLIDDEYLRMRGATDADLVKYRVDPNVEPARLLAMENGQWDVSKDFKRGDVRKVDQDLASSKL